MEDYTLRVTDCVFEEIVQSRLDCADYGIIDFSVPRDMKIEFAVDVFRHGEDSLVRPLKRPVRIVRRVGTSRTTAGLIALRASPMNRADQRPKTQDQRPETQRPRDQLSLPQRHYLRSLLIREMESY